MAQSFREALNSGRFVVTSEIGPPKGTNIEKMCHHIDILKDKVDALNVTDHQSSVMRFPSIGGCLEIKERGGEPILQMTCRDRNQMALQSELLLAYTRGIRNVLCLTGDAIPVGDHKEAKGVFELDELGFDWVCLRGDYGPSTELNRSIEVVSSQILSRFHLPDRPEELD